MSLSPRNKRYLHTLLVAVILLLSFNKEVAAQSYVTQAELEQIQAATYSPDSLYYYPPLFERYINNDATLTLDDYRYLYLGYTFQEGYNPYHENPYTHELRNIAQRIEQENEAECDSIIKYALLAIDDFPFDIRSINILVYALRCKGMYDELEIWSSKLHNLIQTILSTGDGSSPESAWYIINTAHEYDIVNRLGLTAKEQHVENDYYDHLRVEKNNFDIEGYYFNVLRLSEEYARKYSTYE